MLNGPTPSPFASIFILSSKAYSLADSRLIIGNAFLQTDVCRKDTLQVYPPYLFLRTYKAGGQN